jgi:hypothetical protein
MDQSGVIPIAVLKYAVLKYESNVIVKKEYLKIIYKYKLY